MRQNIFKSIAIAAIAVAMLGSGKSAKAEKIGLGLGYEFDRDLVAIDFLFPLERHGAKRPRGGVLNFGLRIMGVNDTQDGAYSEEWISFALPILYEHVFERGLSASLGLEYRYYDAVEGEASSPTKTSFMGGGIVGGSNYFFKNGIFFGWKIAAGVVYQQTSTAGGDLSSTHGYIAPTLSFGYML